jgi:hypothetical protein
MIKICILLLLPFTLAAEISRNGDFQFWLYDAFTKDIGKKSKIYLETEGRWGDDASTLYLFYLQTRVMYAVCKWLDVAPGYRQQWNLDLATRKWFRLYDPLVDVIVKKKIGKWEISDRHRTQYFILESLPNFWQYRNRFMVISPWKIGKMKLNPLVFDEIFIREQSGFSENRFAIGGSMPLAKKAKTTLFYMLRHQEFLEWRRHHICWLQFECQF